MGTICHGNAHMSAVISTGLLSHSGQITSADKERNEIQVGN